MRYRCINKKCSYKYRGSVGRLPDDCPKCGGKLEKYRLAKTIGDEFEKKVMDMFNTYLDLKGYDKVKRTPMSGAIKGKKGDLYNLPNWLPFIIECKSVENAALKEWWDQCKKESLEMGKNPWLIFRVGNDILGAKILKTDLKVVKKLKGGK